MKRKGENYNLTWAQQATPIYNPLLWCMDMPTFDSKRHAKFSHAHYIAMARIATTSAEKAAALASAAVWRGLCA